MERDPVVRPGCVVVLVHCPSYSLALINMMMIMIVTMMMMMMTDTDTQLTVYPYEGGNFLVFL